MNRQLIQISAVVGIAVLFLVAGISAKTMPDVIKLDFPVAVSGFGLEINATVLWQIGQLPDRRFVHVIQFPGALLNHFLIACPGG